MTSKTLNYAGLVDHGKDEETSSDLADHGLVCMFCPFGENYAQPIGVFASKNATRGTVLCQLLLQAITLLEAASALIHGVVSDEASPNRTMWSQLNVSGKLNQVKNFFEHPVDPQRKEYMFSDVSHLFKCIRNRLHKQKYLQCYGT